MAVLVLLMVLIPPSTEPAPAEKSNVPPTTSLSTVQAEPSDPQGDYQTILGFITDRYKTISREDAETIANYLVDYGKEHGVDPKFAAAVIARESAFNK